MIAPLESVTEPVISLVATWEYKPIESSARAAEKETHICRDGRHSKSFDMAPKSYNTLVTVSNLLARGHIITRQVSQAERKEIVPANRLRPCGKIREIVKHGEIAS